MNTPYRVLDANLNRCCEGLRLLEDAVRFGDADAELTAALRLLRHAVRDKVRSIEHLCVGARDAAHDVGLAVSQKSGIDNHSSLSGTMAANWKRVQEGLRVIEETLKAVGSYSLAKEYELLRFRAYELEKRCLPLFRRERARAFLSDLYAITAEEFSLGRTNVEVVARLLEAGIRVVQYRAKDKEHGAKYRECQEVRRLTAEASALLIVNDHPDLALMVGADGVHIGQDDYPIEAVRALVGDGLLIGVSTHSPAQAEEAVRRGADYVGVGPIFPTQTKKNPLPAVGLEYLDYAVAHVAIPFVAIGGIKLHNVGLVRQRGAQCIAMVTEIVGAVNIVKRVQEIREALAQVEGRQT
ncbi:MAG: thiamine phosphate synthase [Anaerolineae bacterium]